MNFYSDLALILKEELNGKGYVLSTNASDDEIVEGYLNVVHRQIPVEPRTVEESPELVCPPEMVAGYAELKRKASAGEPLKGNQSRTINRPDYYDGLFTDWGIQHFHLGVSRASDGFIQRSGPLLYARVTQDKFYALQIYGHGAWSKQEIVRILQKNWPESVSRYEMKGIKPLGPPRTDEEVTDFRRAGIQALVVAGDKFIYPMGGGYMSSGDSAVIIKSQADVRANCKEFAEQTRSIVDSAAAHGHKFKKENIKLIKRDGKAMSIDESSKTPIAQCDWFIRSELQ